MVSFTTISEARASYEHWLTRQPLSTHTRRTYLTQVNRYCIYLSTFPWEYGHPLQEPHARDRAIALLLFYTGLRISECAALQLSDVRLSSRKGLVIVRMGKGNAYREVPLNAEVRTALDAWLQQRQKWVSQRNESALFLTKQGTRLATRTIDDVVRRLGQEAHLSLSAHILRHTCLTSLVRHGNDLVLVAELAGHKRLETTRRYSLPTAADREAAMEGLKVDY